MARGNAGDRDSSTQGALHGPDAARRPQPAPTRKTRDGAVAARFNALSGQPEKIEASRSPKNQGSFAKHTHIRLQWRINPTDQGGTSRQHDKVDQLSAAWGKIAAA